MALKLECVNVVPQGKIYVAYVQLMDGDTVIAKTALPYDPDDKEFGDKAARKFKSRVNTWLEEKTRLDAVQREIDDVLKDVKLGGKEG
jgi:hypothetical protein